MYMSFSLTLTAMQFPDAVSQADSEWQACGSTIYTSLPPIEDVSMATNLKLLCPFHVAQAFTDHNLTIDREKGIHRWGSVVRAKLVAYEKSPFSGVFKTGVDNAIMRFSLAKPSTTTKCTPGFGMKYYIDNHEPINMLAMYRLDGQESFNIFENKFTNVLPKPAGDPKLKVLNVSFKAGLKIAGFTKGNPLELDSSEMASIDQFGNTVENSDVVVPFELIFAPTKEAKALLDGITHDDDFRVMLEGKGFADGQGIRLYKVYARESEGKDPIRIGHIETTSPFINSSYADENLYFRHPNVKTLDKQ